MRIVNLEKLVGWKRIVMTGRDENVRAVAKHLKARLYHCPRPEDYFMDYPAVAEELQEVTSHESGVVIITTQSEEFLDCLLASDINFVLATVRKFDDDEADTYRLRVLSKAEAGVDRDMFHMELRV